MKLRLEIFGIIILLAGAVAWAEDSHSTTEAGIIFTTTRTASIVIGGVSINVPSPLRSVKTPPQQIKDEVEFKVVFTRVLKPDVFCVFTVQSGPENESRTFNTEERRQLMKGYTVFLFDHGWQNFVATPNYVLHSLDTSENTSQHMSQCLFVVRGKLLKLSIAANKPMGNRLEKIAMQWYEIFLAANE